MFVMHDAAATITTNERLRRLGALQASARALLNGQLSVAKNFCEIQALYYGLVCSQPAVLITILKAES